MNTRSSQRLAAGKLPFDDTHPGKLVVERCGCSRYGCIEAIRLGRRWVYIENNPENFRWGCQRIAKALTLTAKSSVG